ncbi:MAG: succinyl-diaminopimelate desuccinylase [Planctomycetes bacterium]|nr:succinyl-diaminopimelate desuccinylase [Planctomycetota bacterium]
MDAPPDSLVDGLLTLLKIRSVLGEELEIANYVENKLRARLSDVRRFGNSMVAFGPRRGRPLVALAGHLDTVSGAPDDPNPPRVEGGRAHGLGASDMKCSIACDLWFLDNHDPVGSPYDLCFVYYDKEEGPIKDNGLLKLWDAVPELKSVDLAICGEPTDNSVQLGCVGSMHVKVIFHGKAAHSARPWQGENAIHKSADFIGKLAALAPRDVVIDQMLFREVISATVATGGRSRNVVPDTFEVSLNARFSAATPPDEMFARIQQMAPGAECKIFDCAPSAPPRRSHPLIEKLIQQLGARVEPKQAWTDVAQFAQHGVAAINFGPGEQALAHQRGESVSLDALETGRRGRVEFLMNR